MATTAPDGLLNMSQVAERFGVTLMQVYRLIKDGRLTVVEERRTRVSGRPAKMIALAEAEGAFVQRGAVQEFHRAEAPKREERLLAAAAAGRPLDGIPIGLREAARKYEISHTLILSWIAKGSVLPYAYTEGGRVDRIDEASVWDRLQSFKPYRRRTNGRKTTGLRPSKRGPQPYGANAATNGHSPPQSIDALTAAAGSDTRSTFALKEQYRAWGVNLRKFTKRTWEIKEQVLGPLAEAYPVLPTTTAQLGDFLGGILPIGNGHTVETGRLSGTSLNIRWRDLRAFYNYLNNVREIPLAIKWKTFEPKKDTKLPRVYTPDEIERMARAAVTITFQTFVIFRLLLESGPRASEAANLQDTDLRDGMIRVKGKTGAKGFPDRDVPVQPHVYKWLLRLAKEHGPGPVFRDRLHHPITSDGVGKRMADLAELAGITGRKKSAHTLRHTFATSFYRATKDIVGLAFILGHLSASGVPNIKTTQIYITLANSDVAAAYAMFKWENLPQPPEQMKLAMELAME